ncbi:flagellar protein FlaG [Desulfosporosinus nitroreducens]|uniref:flagellar protein FlaG n=1 Tax=Desulfosporosinus nitroreducens TaxID=2018668 RepID=UPI00207D454D|nr:flagellar protein FlaG [Desulfosporosinus nitroreducens]MCO1601321.1 flagellar protein FlaG [Desulfosporosinus nitroreducens]
MDIVAVKNPIDFGISPQVTQTTPLTQAVDSGLINKSGDVADKSVTATTDEKGKKPTDLQELTQKTEAMNKFIKAMDTNIQFKLHEGTNQLMVQVVDQDSDKVLKEFPPSEFLDTIAAIRDYVGILLDKKI